MPIRIPLPNLSPDDKEELVDHFNFYLEELSAAIDPDLSHIDNRAELLETTVSTVDWDQGAGSIELHLELEYSCYYGCKDIDGGGVDEQSIAGVIRGQFVEFEPYTPVEQRSTYEEY